jgi:MoaA/NifB/PqqE/SkfB family radical SAM enzyme
MKKALLPLYAALYSLSHRLKRNILLPAVVTYGVTEACDGHCATCGVWKADRKEEMSRDEWKRIISGFGSTPIWITMTGGDQSLREDFPDIVNDVARINKPSLITVPISAIDRSRSMKMVERLLKLDIPLFLNFSVDGPEALHDEIRGLKGSYRNTKEVLAYAQDHAPPSTIIGTYTVISPMNIHHLDDVLSAVKKLAPDHYGFEMAERRIELNNETIDLLSEDERKIALEFLESEPEHMGSGMLELKHQMRHRYYNSLGEKRSRCFSGIASVQITSTGKVLQCGIKGRELGDLKTQGYDVKKVLKSEQAEKVMKTLHTCSCTHCTPRYLASLIDFTNPSNIIAYAKLLGKKTNA